MHPLRTLVLLAAVASPLVANAGSPRTITPPEVIAPTCFGFAEGGAAVYAVRLKATCDVATNQCEAASYLSRVTPDGKGKTVGYLSLKRGETLPDAAALIASSGAPSVQKAQAAMSDAVMPCAVAKDGEVLVLDGGRKVHVGKTSEGLMALRSDNWREVVVPKDVEQVFWGPGAKTWFYRRTLPVEGGVDATFQSVNVSSLFLATPKKPSAAAVAITHQNLVTDQCLGFDAGGAAYWNRAEVAGDTLIMRVHRLGGGQPYEIARRVMPAALKLPSLTAATVTLGELAFANSLLSDVTMPCTTTALTELSKELTARGKPVQVSLLSEGQRRVVRFVGPEGGRADIAVSADALRLVTAPDSPTWYLLDGDDAAKVELGVVLGTPSRFPLAVGAEPTCFESRVKVLVDVEQRTDGAVLVARQVGTAFVTDLARGPKDATPDALMQLVERDTLIDLAAVHPNAKPCTLAALGAEKKFELAGQWHTLTRTERGWVAARPGYEQVIGNVDAEPRWVFPGSYEATLVFEDASSKLSFIPTTVTKYTELPDPPEVAMKAPKLLSSETPGPVPADKRCLAWSSKDKVAWIVRWMPDDSAVLTEVRKEGYYQRVTLAKALEDWTHMFDHANNFLGKADLGCLAGRTGNIAGHRFEVVTNGTKVEVRFGDKVVKAGSLVSKDDYDNTIERSLGTAFYHPDVKAIVIELDGGEQGDGYLAVDLAKALP